MLFRLVLILSVLLASAESAPIFIRNHPSRAQIRIPAGDKGDLHHGPCSAACVHGTVPPKTSEDTVIKIVTAAAILFVLAIIIVAICVIYCYLKKKPMKDDESQYCADDFKESNTKLNGKHEDYIAITIDDFPHGSRNEQIDVLSGPPDVITNISPDEDEVTFSNNQEVKTTITNEDVPHGPVAEKGDVLKDTKITMAHPTDPTSSLDGNVVIPSDGEFDIFCTSRDIIMPHKARIVEMKESEIKPDLNDYNQTSPSILKGSQMKNKNKVKTVYFEESDNRYVYSYDSESSQPGCQIRYFRNEQGWKKKKSRKKAR